MANIRIQQLVLSVVLIFSSTISFVVSFSPVNPNAKQRHQNNGIIPLQGVAVSCPAYTSTKKERTLYDILGASPDSTRAVLKRKYLDLAKLTHPDANPNIHNSDKFTEVAHAWHVLSDQKSRLKYDRSLVAAEFLGNFDEFTEVINKAAAPIFEYAVKATEEATKEFRASAVTFFENAVENALRTTVHLGRMAFVAGQQAGAAMR